MGRFFDRLDEIASLEGSSGARLWLERIIFVFVILTFISAPHSIAATQTAWLTGTALWLVRIALRPRPRFRFTPLDAALFGLFAWSVVTSLASYAPDISVDKLRGASVFLIFYFAYYNLRSMRSVYFAAFALIVSCMVNVAWVPVQRIIGRGVEIHGVMRDGPLGKAILLDGDTLLDANGKKFATPSELLAEIERGETTKIKFYRPDFYFWVDVKRADLFDGATAEQRLGFREWKRSRNWRSTGFYGHYTTYAEVLQLVGSLLMGLFASWFGGGRISSRRPFLTGAAFVAALGGLLFALLLTVTRASQLAFVISCALIVFLGVGKKWFFGAAALAVPLALVGLLFLQQSRQVGFFDQNDDSIKWRQTVWREGFDLWTSSPRNFVAGVGMDSIKRFAGEWRLFDDGRLPIGHFHSTPLQLLVERGLPALIIWLLVLGIYARTMWRALRRDTDDDWRRRGIILGCLGGTLGFFASSLVHYNLGDQEVAMVFFLLMALAVRACGEGVNGLLDSAGKRSHA